MTSGSTVCAVRPSAKATLARRALRDAEAKTGVTAARVRAIDSMLRDVSASGGSPLGSMSSHGMPVWSCDDLARHAATHVEPGSTVSVEGSTSALFAVAAAMWGPSRWGVFAGLPNAGLLAARQAGIPLDRTVVVPGLGAEPLRVLAALVDSYGVVVTGPLAMASADRRRIEARVRHRRTHLIVAGSWPGARMAIEVARVVRDGIGQGNGTLGAAYVVASTRSRVHELWERAAG